MILTCHPLHARPAHLLQVNFTKYLNFECFFWLSHCSKLDVEHWHRRRTCARSVCLFTGLISPLSIASMLLDMQLGHKSFSANKHHHHHQHERSTHVDFNPRAVIQEKAYDDGCLSNDLYAPHLESLYMSSSRHTTAKLQQPWGHEGSV